MPKPLTENEKKLINLTYISDFQKVFDSILLSDRQKEIFRLYYGKQWKMIDIADKLNIHQNTVSEEIKPMYAIDETESHEFTEQDAYDWVNGMVNSDGTRGQHWNIEQTTSVAEQVGVEFEHISKYCWYATLNMIYSDYCETAKKFGVNNVDFYTDMAKGFLFDVDSVSPKEKMYYYYKYIVKH